MEERISQLLSQMTLREKARQLDQYFGTSFMSASHPHMVTVMADDAEIRWDKVKALIGEEGIGCIHDLYGTAEVNNAIQRYAVEETRLGIPILFSEEALHGLLRPGCTVFPHAIATASTWNPHLAGRIGQAIAAETRSFGIHETFGPVLDLAREPRWGRVEETFGEDTYLTSRMGVAMIRGLQGDDLASQSSIIAEPKHFAVHGIPESGLNHGPAIIGMNDIRSYHLPVFEAAFKEGGALNAMCAYNSIDGVPCAADAQLLTELLRGEWGMPGFVRSDLGAIARLQNAHHTAGSAREAIRQALEAGTDMQYYDFPHDEYQDTLVDLVNSGEISETSLDTAVARVLRVKFMLGLFDNPYTDVKLSPQVVRSKAHGELALQAARESLCLLRNEEQTLPLSKNLKSIAVIGPSADQARLGDYTPHIEGFTPVTLLQGIRSLVSAETRVLSARGTGILGDELEPIPTACLVDGNGNPGLHAAYYNNLDLRGEAVLTRTDPQIRFNWIITKPDEAVDTFGFSVRWTGKLVPQRDMNGLIGTVSQDSMRLWLDGELLIDGWGQDNRATQSVPVQLQAGQAYDLRVEYGKDTNGVDIQLGWSTLSEGIREAAELARQADVAIVALGDSERTCGEGVDRSSLALPGNQLDLLKAVYETGTPVVLVLQNGRPLTLEWEAAHIPAILEAWLPGENGGTAIAEVLFGDVNPAGRLPITFPRSLGQLPVYYNRRRGGQRHYVEGDNRPLFAFGHGLSYTTFGYGELQLSTDRISMCAEPGVDASGTAGNITPAAPLSSKVSNDGHRGMKPLLVSVPVTNTGDVGGDEVVQLYLSDLVSSVARPELELKRFQRLTLAPGQTELVSFQLTADDFKLLDRHGRWVVEPGAFRILVGPASDRIIASAEIWIA